ncbi:MAG: hypothetical protein HY594_01940 [Candidatus Omnitrophica bacterium]|nr:hypothetical protein [Candidatus Omnitrophota bacterium]
MDLYIEVDPNPNCEELPGMMYQALENPRPVSKLRVRRGETTQLCWVTGVGPSGPNNEHAAWKTAYVQKITDSGAGVAYCIYGGRWGLRFQPANAKTANAKTPAWNLDAPDQWGEPYKIYGDMKDMVLSRPLQTPPTP